MSTIELIERSPLLSSRVLIQPGVAAPDVTRKLAEKNVLASAIGPSHVRFVTHMDVDRGACVAQDTLVGYRAARGWAGVMVRSSWSPGRSTLVQTMRL